LKILKAHIKFNRIIGLAGIHPRESVLTHRLATFFEWYMLCIALWLPFQWHFAIDKLLSDQTLLLLNWFVWLSFILEAFVLYLNVKYKLYYFWGNWLNVLIIIIICPFFYQYLSASLGSLRLIRILLLLRIIIPWTKSAHNALALNRIGMTLLIFIISTMLSGIIVSLFDPNINTPLKGIWWAWETVTTVGYGDMVPSSIAGKLTAMIIMILGIILFSVVTASISAYFIGRDKEISIHDLISKNRRSLAHVETLLEKLTIPISTYDSSKIAEFIEELDIDEKNQLLHALQKSLKRNENDEEEEIET